jgi:hypothetical protein
MQSRLASSFVIAEQAVIAAHPSCAPWIGAADAAAGPRRTAEKMTPNPNLDM